MTFFDPLPLPRRLLLVKTSSLGDIVHALPLAVSLRYALPKAHITWAVKAKFADLLRDNPHLDSIAILPDSRPASVWAFGKQLRREQFDTALDLQGLLVSGVVTRLSGAPVRVGFDLNREQNARFLTHAVVPGRARIPMSDALHGFLDVFGLPRQPITPQKYLACGCADEAESLLAPLAGKPIVACIVGASRVDKSWPVERWAELIQILAAQGLAPVLLGGASEKAAALALALHIPAAQNLIGQTSLRLLASLLARCAVVVGGDSGPFHLAVAVGTPAVGLYGVTDPARTGPDWGCAPSRTLDFAQTDAPPATRRSRHTRLTDALARIPAQAVADAVHSLLRCETTS